MITGRRWSAGPCGLLAALATALLALGASPPEAAAEPVEDTPPPRVELVLDVSGSMRVRDVGGRSRMAAARQAFNEVLDAVPEEVHLGIRTLGARYPGDDREIGCRDSEQLYPVGRVDRLEAKAAVATLRPTGWTPIGYALRGADRDLGDGEGTRRIVLITDGEDSCGDPDPCVVARELAAQGTHLVVDTLGLASDAGVREQLSCIADATGGTYTAVQDTEQLSERIKQLVRRSADTPVETPTAVEGASERCAEAPLLGTGVYSDRAEFGEHRRYRVRMAPGQELRTSVSVAADRAVDRGHGVLLRAVDERGRELARSADAGYGRTDVVSTGLRHLLPEDGGAVREDAGSGAGSDEDDGEAEPRRTVCLEVAHAFSAPDSVRRTPGLPVELTVDLVAAPDGEPDAAAFGLARGWVPLMLLTSVGLVAGLLWGLRTRLGGAVRRTR